jgi:hypothetical protein
MPDRHELGYLLEAVAASTKAGSRVIASEIPDIVDVLAVGYDVGDVGGEDHQRRHR